MTPQERAALAEQLLANVLLAEILREIEADATERLIYAKTEESRVASQANVLSARDFKAKIDAALSARQTPKRAPA